MSDCLCFFTPDLQAILGTEIVPFKDLCQSVASNAKLKFALQSPVTGSYPPP